MTHFYNDFLVSLILYFNLQHLIIQYQNRTDIDSIVKTSRKNIN